jgi:integrase
MATIQKRVSKEGKPSYRVMVRLRGYPAQYATFDRKTDAADWATQTEAAIKEGRYFLSREAKKHTLAELVDRYEEQVLAEKPKAKRLDQERHLRWWREKLGPYRLADVTPGLIGEQRDVLSKGTTHYARRRSAGTVNRYLTSLSHAFTIAVREWGWVNENPVRNVKKLTEPGGRVRFLSEDEKDRLLEASKVSSEPRLYPLVVLALSTGARRGEILGLRWTDIDLERGLATLHETRNRERRSLPLQSLALEVFSQLGRVRRIDTDLVLADTKGRATFPRGAWDRALEAAEIPDFRFHDLRHTAASYLAMSGATLAEIAEVLGHKTLAMVKRYAHLTEAHTAGVVARMNERFLGSGQ